MSQFIFFLALVIGTLSYANQSETSAPIKKTENLVKSTNIFKDIERLQNIKVSQGVCQNQWKSYTEHWQNQTKSLNSIHTIVVTPCAQWSLNLSWTAYLIIDEPSHPKGYWIRELQFVRYSHNSGLFGSPLIHNFQWKNQIIYSRFFEMPRAKCGQIYEYTWDTNQQVFIVKHILSNNDCSGAPGHWVPIIKK